MRAGCAHGSDRPIAGSWSRSATVATWMARWRSEACSILGSAGSNLVQVQPGMSQSIMLASPEWCRCSWPQVRQASAIDLIAFGEGQFHQEGVAAVVDEVGGLPQHDPVVQHPGDGDSFACLLEGPDAVVAAAIAGVARVEMP